MLEVRKDFPILERKINGKKLIYFDNAATTQKPIQVIEKLREFYLNYNANIHRSIHTLGEEATEMFENTRKLIAKFINAKPEEIIFTKNTSESLNLVTHSYGKELNKGDKVLTTIMEHHSNFVPWQYLSKEKDLNFEVVDINEEGYLNYEDFIRKFDKKTKVFTVTQASNILGTINDIESLAKIIHENDCIIVVDGAQSVPHLKIDVKKLDVDFLAFSAHKMLGPTGIGILYGKKEILEEMEPFLKGGEMIKEVKIEYSTWKDLPYKFEAGTPNIADVVAFGEAIKYLQKIGMDKIREHDIELTKYALEKLSEIKNLEVYGPKDAEDKVSVISFNIKNIHSHDVAEILDRKFGIAVRSGHGCAMPLMNRLEVNSVVRASFYIYNTKEEIDVLIEGINYVKKFFKVE